MSNSGHLQPRLCIQNGVQNYANQADFKHARGDSLCT
jgi:hypothetical protein